MKFFNPGLIAALIISLLTGAVTDTQVFAATGNDKTIATNSNQNGVKTITPVENTAVEVTSNSAKLYSKIGSLSSRELSQGSDWKVGSELFRNDGSTYFQVSTDEFLPADAGYLYGTFNGVAKIATRTPAPLYNHNLKKISGRSLAPNSSWQTDRTINVYPADNTKAIVHYYRVSTDEWVSSDDIDPIVYTNSVTSY
ncbi:hypothetical protein [Companilactobacillus furfuricola]|uniref:hypothetical protein n=1 Tax=Companilactobacillus furfuricola TaxID=1462575 RepID=UPI000F79A869|nr:hypothetical protein [Companilactobacillus furfuricola]